MLAIVPVGSTSRKIVSALATIFSASITEGLLRAKFWPTPLNIFAHACALAFVPVVVSIDSFTAFATAFCSNEAPSGTVNCVGGTFGSGLLPTVGLAASMVPVTIPVTGSSVIDPRAVPVGAVTFVLARRSVTVLI